MRSRAIQLALLIALGVTLGLLVSRPWRSDDAQDAPALRTVEPARVSAGDTAAPPADIAPPPARTFKLPAVAAPAVVQAKPKARVTKPPSDPQRMLVPKDWLLRGTGPDSYDAKIDRGEVFTGLVSVQLSSHDKDVANTKSASLMQSIAADPWVGKRVEFSIRTKAAGLRQHVDAWIRATDAGKAVIAYDHFETMYDKPEWRKRSVVLDIPWSAAEIAYGVSLNGVGTVWMDNAQLLPVDKAAVNVTGHTLPSQLGVLVQDADDKPPLSMPSNLDFEDVVPVDETFRRVPPDAVGRTRF